MRVALQGVPVVPGVAVGQALIVDRRGVPSPRRLLSDADEIEREVNRLNEAVRVSREKLESMRTKLSGTASGEHLMLLDVELLMHQDSLVLDGAQRAIGEHRVNAEWAVQRVIDGLAERLQRASEPHFRERANDVAHIGERILRELIGYRSPLASVSETSVVIATDLSPSEATSMLGKKIAGLVTEKGGLTSHTAVLARSLGCPAIVGVPNVARRVSDGESVILDAIRGELVVGHGESETREADTRRTKFLRFSARLRDARAPSVQTADGAEITLRANAELEGELEGVVSAGADGIGLFRTEYLFPTGGTLEEQVATYRRIAKALAPRTVTLRLFDRVQDKVWHRPGERGTGRQLGAERLEQIDALVFAYVDQPNIRILVPRVAGVDDFMFVREEIALAARERGLDSGPRVGAMIELPSAAMVADALARIADFFSMGTNDLTQYTLGIDRKEPGGVSAENTLHPGLLRLLERSLSAANAALIPTAVCGHMAQDPFAIPILLGLGFRELSVPPIAMDLVSAIVRRTDLTLASSVARALAANELARREALQRFERSLGKLWRDAGVRI